MKIDRRGFLAASSSALVLAKSQLSSAKHFQPSEPSDAVFGRRERGQQSIRPPTKAITAFRDRHSHLQTDGPTAGNADLRVRRSREDVSNDSGRRRRTHRCLAETFAKLPKAKQQEFLNAYFDRDTGIGYTLARTNIHSCDFSSGSYTYVDEGDKELKSFSVEHDKQFRIPFIKQALAAAGGKLNIFASPWSPPAFMKDNNNMLRGGKLKPEFYQSWANYFAKFIKAYEREGIPIWGITIQNEPMATQKWESCIFSAEEERDFLEEPSWSNDQEGRARRQEDHRLGSQSRSHLPARAARS